MQNINVAILLNLLFKLYMHLGRAHDSVLSTQLTLVTTVSLFVVSETTEKPSNVFCQQWDNDSGRSSDADPSVSFATKEN